MSFPSKLRIHQFHSGSVVADAVTDGMFFAQSLLRDLGFESEIFVGHVDARLRGRLNPLKDLRIAADDILLVHHSMGHDALDFVAGLRCRKVLVYHNITPPYLFDESDGARPYAVKGYAQLATLREMVEAAIVDSPFNAQELAKRGFRDVTVIPLLKDFAVLRQAPHDPTPYYDRSAVYRILFVGRVVPSKCQHELIEFVDCIRTICHVPLQLVLAGKLEPESDYQLRLDRMIAANGLSDQVKLTGEVGDEELSGWYRAADAYLSFSEHEGFGARLIEAMVFDLPVLAYAPPDSAMAETLGGAGLALPGKDPRMVAGVLARLYDDPLYKSELLRAGRNRVARLSRRRIKKELLSWLVGLGICEATAELAEAEEQTDRRRSEAARSHYVIEGPYETSYSLAIVNRNLAAALDRRQNVIAHIEPMEGNEHYTVDSIAAATLPPEVQALVRPVPVPANRVITIRNTYPTRPNGMLGDVRLLHLFWEESALPAGVAGLINFQLDGVLAPSEYTKRVIRNSGVRVPIAVIGCGVDHIGAPAIEVGSARCGPVSQAMPFTFLHISSGLARKGIEELVIAYCLAFAAEDPVLLVIKTFDNPTNVVEEWVQRLTGIANNAPAIQVISDDLDQRQLHFIYSVSDRMVLPTRGEGFNLPAAEALAMGIPLIVTRHSGHLDFCTEGNSRLIDYTYEASGSHLKVANSYWARPSVDDLVQTMKCAYREGRSPGSVAMRRAQQGCRDALALCWSEVAHRVEEFVGELDRRTIVSRKLRLAWVSTYNAHCGIAAHSAHLLEFFSTDAFEVTIVADDQPLAGVEPENIVRIWTQEGITRLADFVIDNRFDAVVFQHHPAFYSFTGLAGMLLRLFEADIPTFVELHQTKALEHRDGDDVTCILERALRSCTRIFLHNIDDINRLKGLKVTDNLVLLPLGVPTRDPMDGGAVRSLLGITHVEPVIGTFGFLLPHKGLMELIHAFALLLKTYPSAYLLMLNADYGNIPSKEEYARCLALTRMLGLGDRIRLINEFLEIDEILLLLSACHVVVYPYQRTDESASAAVRLGLAAGRPVAATPLPVFSDLADVVYQLPGCAPVDIAEGIVSLLRDAGRRDEIVERQRNWVAANSWGAQAARIANIILGCVEEARQVQLQVPTLMVPTLQGEASATRATPENDRINDAPNGEETTSRQSTDFASNGSPIREERRHGFLGRFGLGFTSPRRVPPERTAMARADRARDARDWKTATRCYREALLLVPDDAAAWVQYGHALKESGDAAAAEAAYRKSLELAPGVADTHLQLGHALKLRGRKIEAGVAYARALALDPALDHAMTELKALGWSKGRIELALRSEHGRRA